jgi:hypothetical protein
MVYFGIRNITSSFHKISNVSKSGSVDKQLLIIDNVFPPFPQLRIVIVKLCTEVLHFVRELEKGTKNMLVHDQFAFKKTKND